MPVFCLLACRLDEQPCTPYVRQGDAIEVTVIGKEETASSAFLDAPPCPIDDVALGDHFKLQIGAPLLQNTCYHFSCSDDFPATSEPLGASVPSGGLNYLCYRSDRKIQLAASCHAGRFVALYTPLGAADVYAPASPDGSTAVHMVRALTFVTNDVAEIDCREPPEWADRPDRYERSHICADVWRVELTKRE